MAQLMPLPLTVSCFSEIQIGFTFLVPAHPGSPGKRAVKRVYVYVITIAFNYRSLYAYEKRCYFYVRSKAYMSQIDIQQESND